MSWRVWEQDLGVCKFQVSRRYRVLKCSIWQKKPYIEIYWLAVIYGLSTHALGRASIYRVSQYSSCGLSITNRLRVVQYRPLCFTACGQTFLGHVILSATFMSCHKSLNQDKFSKTGHLFIGHDLVHTIKDELFLRQRSGGQYYDTTAALRSSNHCTASPK